MSRSKPVSRGSGSGVSVGQVLMHLLGLEAHLAATGRDSVSSLMERAPRAGGRHGITPPAPGRGRGR